jgi:hypothetical protein
MTKRRIQFPDSVPKEDAEQAKLVTYLRYKGLLFFSVPNGEKRDIITAVKLKRTGVMAGVPDIVIPMPSNGYHGLFIELKRVKGGQLTASQRHWLEALKVQGYYAVVCNGADHAIQIVNSYFHKANENAKI